MSGAALGKRPSFSGPQLPQLRREVEAGGQLPGPWCVPGPQGNEAHHRFPRADPAGTAPPGVEKHQVLPSGSILPS